MRKAFQIMLNVLLLVGALACVFTINGGKWLSSGVSIYPTMEVPIQSIYLMQAAYSADNPSTPESGPQVGCYPITLPAIPTFFDTFMTYNRHNPSGASQNPAAPRSGGC